ncbi:MAG: MBL fold metallo-hydrolase [Paracoccaceae bacterium]|jgi:glyoxylase-like metal-dependent hydrolase (beta-lactamase superfamily II)
MAYRPLGNLRLRRVVESIWTADVDFFFKDTTPEDWAPHLDWLCPDALDRETWRLKMPMQSYVIQTPHHNIMVDTCVGAHKELPQYPEWHRNDHARFVTALNAHGLTFEDIDFVMCTHLHTDHTGWNTRLEDGRWVPTFPNARYIFSKKEYEHWAGVDNYIYRSNVLPVVEAGRAELVQNDFALDDHVWLEPSPGHTPDHVCVHARSQGEHAIITGDLFHSPIQFVKPHWHNAIDWDKDQGAATRLKFMETHADTDALICTIHFPLPSAGFFRRKGDGFAFDYDTVDW